MDVHSLASTCHIIIIKHILGPEVDRIEPEMGTKGTEKDRKWTRNRPKWLIMTSIDQKGNFLCKNLSLMDPWVVQVMIKNFGVSSGGCRGL